MIHVHHLRSVGAPSGADSKHNADYAVTQLGEVATVDDLVVAFGSGVR